MQDRAYPGRICRGVFFLLFALAASAQDCRGPGLAPLLGQELPVREPLRPLERLDIRITPDALQVRIPPGFLDPGLKQTAATA